MGELGYELSYKSSCKSLAIDYTSWTSRNMIYIPSIPLLYGKKKDEILDIKDHQEHNFWI